MLCLEFADPIPVLHLRNTVTVYSVSANAVAQTHQQDIQVDVGVQQGRYMRTVPVMSLLLKVIKHWLFTGSGQANGHRAQLFQ